MKAFPLAVLLLVILGGSYWAWARLASSETFPEQLGEYTLSEQTGRKDCSSLNGKEICTNQHSLWYRADGQLRLVQVIDVSSDSDLAAFREAVILGGDGEPTKIELDSFTLYKPEQHEIAWWTSDNRIFVVQEYAVMNQPDGSEISRFLVADGANSVTKWFLENFPPQQD